MKLTIDQALKKAVEAHKAGRVREADYLYTVILKAQPKHPDANHNLGVLAVSVGKLQAALPFFRTAMEVNPSSAQFWISYIDVLIKLDRNTVAQAVLEQAKRKGIKSDAFEMLYQQLQKTDPRHSIVNTLVLPIVSEQSSALDKAFHLKENGEYNEAIKLLKDAANQLPEDAGTLALLSHCYMLTEQLNEAKFYLGKARAIAPDCASVGWNTARLKLKEKKLLEALQVAKSTHQRFPDDIEGMGVLGACFRLNGEVAESLNILNKAIELNPNYVEALINRGLIKLSQSNNLEAMDDLELAHKLKPHLQQIWDFVVGLKLEAQDYSNAIVLLNKMTEMDPKNDKLFVALAGCYQHLKDFTSSEVAYKKALAIMPKNAQAYNNMGVSLKEQGKLEEAAEAYHEALAIKPDFAQAYNNLGNALQGLHKLEAAIAAYQKALAIKPDYTEACYNMGNILKEQGKLEEAVEAYHKAIAIKPDFAECYSNMGICLKEQGKLEEAVKAYQDALAIKPDYAGAFWNLSGTAESISEAKNWVKQCLSADPNYLLAQLTLPALEFYEGDKSSFSVLRESSLRNHPYMRSFVWAFELPYLPELYFHRWALFDRMMEQSKQNRPFYEYGVWRGESFRYLIKTFKVGFGFDTFDGIPEDWHEEKAGSYSGNGNIPRIEGGEFIVGKFEDTLAKFFSKPRPKASIINFDADLYSSTICALNFSKPVIDKHTILIFDEFLMNKNWEQDEYKALNEFCLNNGCTYEVLAISFFTKQVAVRLIGI
jgi:tetratricopeptide (TPR) repeat protein